MPETPEAQQEVLAAFGAWMASVGDGMVDPGAPLSVARTVSSAGAEDGQTLAQIGGYSVIQAADLDAAQKLVESHPFIARGGTLQVTEAIEIGGS
jgi:hypothetical protein